MTTYLSSTQYKQPNNQIRQANLELDSGHKNTAIKDIAIRENGNGLYVR